MKYLNGARLRRVVCASVVLGSTVVAVAPQAAFASTVTTKEKGTVSCTVGSFGTYTLKLVVKTTYNNAVTAGSSESASAKATITIPAALNTAEYSAGFRSYNGSVTQALIDNNDATPSPYNAASNNTITIADTNIVSGATSTLSFNIATAGPFTFTSAGTDTPVAGDAASNTFATATVDLYTKANEKGTKVPITATCVVPVGKGGGAYVLGTITVS